MHDFLYDYSCRSVGEGINKYNIANEWWAEFDAYDIDDPLIYMQVAEIRNSSAMMNLNLMIVENSDDECPGCIVYARKK